MTEHEDNVTAPQQPDTQERKVRFPELAELEDKIQRRLRSNQRFLERFMDEDFDDMDDDDETGCSIEGDEPEQQEEL